MAGPMKGRTANHAAELQGAVAGRNEQQDQGQRPARSVPGDSQAGGARFQSETGGENHFNGQGSGRTAVLLSGKWATYQSLQYTLKSSVFVQDVHGFLKQYGGHQQRRPEEHIWVYDEAQRAWDASRVQEKRGHSLSEPEDFLRIGERMDSWALMVGLIGEGQEIHLGEEAGLAQWNSAIASSEQPWIVHCPTKIAPLFLAAARKTLPTGGGEGAHLPEKR